jgi:MerR family transcriptional regulator, copper efflux regulator
MRITEAARRLGTSPRMLRYREDLGLLPEVRDRYLTLRPPRRRAAAAAAPHGSLPGGSVPGGSVPGESVPGGSVPHGPAHRQFSEEDLAAVAAGLELERRFDVSPAALAFGLRVLAEPSVRLAVADLARQLGRIPPAPSRALDFEKERALRLLSR